MYVYVLVFQCSIDELRGTLQVILSSLLLSCLHGNHAHTVKYRTSHFRTTEKIAFDVHINITVMYFFLVCLLGKGFVNQCIFT